uniref:Interleukin 1 receptor type 1 n=1 Tax=Cyclopterus lumpus TaxID=8103 RepID=A0A8C3G920_CYCLU
TLGDFVGTSGIHDTFQVSVGHLFLLKCLFVDTHASVTWSRGGGLGPSLPPGVEVRDGLLWFLPVQMSHAGAYTCEKRDQTGSLAVTFGVSVSGGKCPDPPEKKSAAVGVTELLSCKQKEILELNHTRNIRWVKDCQLMEPPGERTSVSESGFLRLSGTSKEDSGKYTCLVDVSVDGRMYTAARSIWLAVDKGVLLLFLSLLLLFLFSAYTDYVSSDISTTLIVEPQVVAELHCYAYIGFSDDDETLMYWTVNETHTDEHQELAVSFKRGRVYGRSTLSISKVLRQFLNVPISCCVSNSAGFNVGVVWLQEADHSALYTTVALYLSASLAVLLLCTVFLLFRVEVVLAHRKLLRRFSKRAPDGKRYDAYVSFLPPGAPRSAETASLALQVLPEELEKQHGYSLYIRGRDDCPGEAIHDVIADTLSKCRRLIIILSPVVNSSSSEPLGDDQNQLCYEQKVGLYDALTQNDLRVILVEIGGPVDYSVLPESLRYIRRKQGALKWKKSSLRTNKFTNLQSNRNFWKNLRYHMPPVPVGRLQTVV